jgi:hypothetical protein
MAKAQLVCELRLYRNNHDGVIVIHPLRIRVVDKKAKEVKKENAIPVKEATKNEKPNKYTRPAADNSRKTLLNPQKKHR